MKKLVASFGPYTFPIYYVDQQSYVEKVFSRISAENLSLDIETAKKPEWREHKEAGLCPYLSYIRLIQVYDGEAAYVFDLHKVKLKSLKQFLQSKNFVGHNSIFEIKHLTHNGIPNVNIGCTMLMSSMITTAEHSPFDPDEEEQAALEEEPDGVSQYKRKGHSLEAVSGRYLNIRLPKDQQTSDWSAPTLSTEQLIYAGADAFVTYKLGKILIKKIHALKMERHYELLKKTQHVVAEMELSGQSVDWELHESLVEQWDEKRADAQRAGYGYFKDVNLNSTKQMGEWVKYHFRNDPEILSRWPKTAKGAYSFNAFSLANFKQIAPIKHLLEYKEYAKLVSTYGEGLAKLKHPVTGKLHSSFTLSQTATGRMSSRKPNAQNYPRDKEFRKVFVASPGKKLVVADWSQIELRLQAEFSRDPVMLRVYKEGRDIYKVMAASLLGKKVDEITDEERQTGKIIMLALGYGMGAPKLEDQAWKQYGVRINGARSHAAYRKTFKKYIEWCDYQREKAEQLGYGRSVYGKIRRMASKEIYTKAPNFQVQGGAAELLMISLNALYKELDSDSRIVSTVHDELLVECPDNKKSIDHTIQAVEYCMNGAMKYMFPNAASFQVATAKAGNNWAEAKG